MQKWDPMPDMSLKASAEMRALEVFSIFFRVGLFTFGGGWSMVAQLRKAFVERRQWLSESELIDIISVGRSLPGLMTGNIGMMLGNRVGGPLCGFAALVGLSLPPLGILAAAAVFYSAVRGNPYIGRALVGIRAAVVPIIASSVLHMRKASLVSPATWAIAAVSFALALAAPFNQVFLVIGGALAGLALMRHASGGPRKAVAQAPETDGTGTRGSGSGREDDA